MVLKTLVIGFCALMVSLIFVQSVYAVNIRTQYFNITFDEEHGGVVTSLQYKGVEFLTGGKNGAWGTIGLRRSTWDGTGDVCTRWATDMYYQYNQNHKVTVENKKRKYIVTIEPAEETSEILSTNKKIVWHIPKKSTVITVKYNPGYNNEYLYIPFIRNYDLSIGTITYYTINGRIIPATPAPYCESKWYRSSLADYKLYKGTQTVGTMIFVHDLPLSYYSAYYGADLNTWQMHYPFYDRKSKEISMVFYGGVSEPLA